MKQILLLEDDENLNRGISLKLSREGLDILIPCPVFDITKQGISG